MEYLLDIVIFPITSKLIEKKSRYEASDVQGNTFIRVIVAKELWNIYIILLIDIFLQLNTWISTFDYITFRIMNEKRQLNIMKFSWWL